MESQLLYLAQPSVDWVQSSMTPQEEQSSITVAKKTFESITSACAHLTTHIDEHPDTNRNDLKLTIPKQEHLAFELVIIFANNELTLIISEFHWHYSCTDAEDQAWCIESVVNLVTNQARLKETLRGSRVIKSELQTLQDNEWITVATTGTMPLPSFKKKTTRIIQNTNNQHG